MSPNDVSELARQLRDRARLFVQEADLRAFHAQQTLDRAERFLGSVEELRKPPRGSEPRPVKINIAARP